jgi:hypothetical protein
MTEKLCTFCTPVVVVVVVLVEPEVVVPLAVTARRTRGELVIPISPTRRRDMIFRIRKKEMCEN